MHTFGDVECQTHKFIYGGFFVTILNILEI